MVNDEPIHPWSRLAAACDFGNGISSVFDWTHYLFANADLVIAAAREPQGEWVGLSAATHASADGVAIAEGQIHDTEGCLGVSAQSLLIRPRR